MKKKETSKPKVKKVKITKEEEILLLDMVLSETVIEQIVEQSVEPIVFETVEVPGMDNVFSDTVFEEKNLDLVKHKALDEVKEFFGRVKYRSIASTVELEQCFQWYRDITKKDPGSVRCKGCVMHVLNCLRHNAGLKSKD